MRRDGSWSRPSPCTRAYLASGPRCRMDGLASSSIWSRTSTRSSTSDAAARSRGPVAVLAGFVRLTHPFPSLLDGLVVAAVATVAGADAPTAVRLGIAMTALQASIGSLNDVVDAPRDAGHKPGKPISAGLVSAV